ncbi:hypothetical protein IKG16_00720 [Candidatus Saccharibacteria bacterium]|nr:hypothetical protein [Candidatus Saccharibacteria bacterium]
MHEINLVPEIKTQMIKTLKLRNLICFICIIVAAASIGMVAICGAIVGGQNIAMASKKAKIDEMSEKLSQYSNLGEFLTIQGQLNGISTIDDERQVLSRVFNVLDSMVPRGSDKVEISELNIDLQTSTISMDAQADAGQDPLIDYRVLESFKKGVGLTKYDYGRYVDEGGEEIPTICIVESDSDGNIYQENGSIYALWYKNQEGCNPTAEALAAEQSEEESNEENEEKTENEEEDEEEKNQDEQVKIWRTPQFNEWYKDEKMSLEGTIENVPHFESKCINYAGIETENSNNVRWSASNEDCMFTEDGLSVQDSSNGKDANDNLVLRFSASVEVNPAIFNFQNKHMMIIGPVGQDVTDSYKQIEGMFAKRAEDCAEGDLECATNTVNATGEQK